MDFASLQENLLYHQQYEIQRLSISFVTFNDYYNLRRVSIHIYASFSSFDTFIQPRNQTRFLITLSVYEICS